MWRLEYNEDKYPTINTLTVHADDLVDENWPLNLYINHVRICEGHRIVRAFQPVVQSHVSLFSKAATIVVGIGPKAHAQAIANGRALLVEVRDETRVEIAEGKVITAANLAKET